MTEDYKADAGLKQKRETQLERVTKAIAKFDADIAADAAKAAIAAMPDPYIKKERGAPKTPDDACVLCAKRSEFEALVSFIEARSDSGMMPGSDEPLTLARALREQGVVQ